MWRCLHVAGVHGRALPAPTNLKRPQVTYSWHCFTLTAPTRNVVARGKPGKSQAEGDLGSSGSGNDAAMLPIIEVPSTNKPSRPLERSSYRRRSDDEALKEAKKAARRERDARAASVAQLAAKIRSDPAPSRSRRSVMLVDGYNLLNSSAQLKDMASKQLGVARAELEKWIDDYAAVARIECLVVWDAMMGNSKQVSAERAPGQWVVSVYTGNSEADTWIVRQAQLELKKRAYKVVVVSKDNRIQMELSDTDIILLDVNQFMQHLKEVQAGDTSGPAAWRSLWRRPRLSAYTPQTVTALGSDDSDSSGSDSDEAGRSGGSSNSSSVRELIDSEALEQQLEGIVEAHSHKSEVKYRGAGAAYLAVLQSEAGSEEGSGAEDGRSGGSLDSGDDDDLDALLTRKF